MPVAERRRLFLSASEKPPGQVLGILRMGPDGGDATWFREDHQKLVQSLVGTEARGMLDGLQAVAAHYAEQDARRERQRVIDEAPDGARFAYLTRPDGSVEGDSPVTPRAQVAAALVARGFTYAEAGRLVGKSKRTVVRYARDPAFRPTASVPQEENVIESAMLVGYLLKDGEDPTALLQRGPS